VCIPLRGNFNIRSSDAIELTARKSHALSRAMFLRYFALLPVMSHLSAHVLRSGAVNGFCLVRYLRRVIDANEAADHLWSIEVPKEQPDG
jgi:hypothetical protein